MEVDFNGIKVDIADEEQAKAIIAERTASREALRTLKTQVETLGQAEAARAAEIESVRKQAEEESARARALEAAKKGDIEAAELILTEKLTSQHRTTVESLSKQLLNTSLEATLARRTDIMPDARDDARALIAGHLTLHEGKLCPIGDDGKPDVSKSADDFVASWLEKRPHLRTDRTPSNGGGTPKESQPVGATISRAEYDANPSKYAAGVTDRTIKLKD